MRTNFTVLFPLFVACGSPPTPAQTPADDSPAPSASAEPVAPAPPPDTSAAPVASAPPAQSAAPSASVGLPPVPPARVSVTGTVDGEAFTAIDGSARVYLLKRPQISRSSVVVGLTDLSGACGPDLGLRRGSGVTLGVTKGGDGPDTPPITPGTFKVHRDADVVGTRVFFYLKHFDSFDLDRALQEATSATITFTTIDATHVVGKVAATFEHGSIKGTFDVPICSR